MPTQASVAAAVRSNAIAPADATDERDTLLEHGPPDASERPRRRRPGSRSIALLVCVSVGLGALIVFFLVARLLHANRDAPSEPVFDNGLGRTPVMGWNSWNRFGCDVNETVVLAAARELKSSGLAAAGYNLVAVDDCWQLVGRDDNGDLIADPQAFPSGMASLGAQLHRMGFQFGIYSSAGTRTCQNREASLGHEAQDARLFASWGVDLLKFDNCHNEGFDGSAKASFLRYAAMARALNDTGRPINYALCSWGEDSVEDWARQIANSFRMSRDIRNGRDPGDLWHLSYLQILEQAAPMIHKSRPGTFADLDMLEVGNGGLSAVDGRSHFTLWAMLKSPLILGNDLTSMDAETRQTISNKHLIAVNQDSLGRPATRLLRPPNSDVDVQWWVGPLSGDRWVAAVLNTDDFDKVNVSIELDALVGTSDTPLRFRDLWQDGKSVGTYSSTFSVDVEAHGIRAFEISRA